MTYDLLDQETELVVEIVVGFFLPHLLERMDALSDRIMHGRLQ